MHDAKFNSYLKNYYLLLESFRQINKNSIVSDNILRKLFYYGSKTEYLEFSDTVLDEFYLYFSGKTLNDYEYQGNKARLILKVQDQFESEFEFWYEIDEECYIETSLFKKVIKLIDLTSLDKSHMTFLVLNVVHFGEGPMRSLIEMNSENEELLSPLFKLAAGKHIREGWRAEYFLSQMKDKLVHPFLYHMENEYTSENQQLVIGRIKNKCTLHFLERLMESNYVLKEFASQVVKQLKKFG